MEEYKSELEEVRKERRKKKQGDVNASNEFFTPSDLVKKMCDKIPEEDWADLTKTFLEPCLGNGNFIVEIISRKLNYCKSEEDVYTSLSNVYGVELMEDNLQECKERVLMLLIRYSSSHGMDLNDRRIMKILDGNFVCSDFFKWNFEEWRPYTEEELKQISKKKK